MKRYGLITFLFIALIAAQTGLSDYTQYPDYDSVVTWVQNFAAENPEICRAESLGFSTRDSLPIWGFKISDNPGVNEDEPAVFINGAIHAEEVIGVKICQFIADSLAASYGLDSTITRWINEMEIWFVPVVNPEGYQVVMEGLDYTYRKNKRDNNDDGRFSYVYYHGNDTDGVDLNRNFPFNWDGIDSEASMFASSYRGPAPGSESETQAMMRLCNREGFMASVWYHSSATGLLNEKVFYPWGWATCPDFSRNSHLGLHMSNRMLSYSHVAYVSGPVDKQYGSSIDWEYATHATASLIVEVDTTTQPDSSLWGYQMRNQWDGIEYFLNRILGESVIVHTYAAGVDTPIVARVEVLETMVDYLPPRMSEPEYGGFHRLMRAGDFSLVVCCYELCDTIPFSVLSGTPTYIDAYLDIESVSEIPIEKEIVFSAFPNPFNSACSFDTQCTGILHIVDISGRQIDVLNVERGSNLWQPPVGTASGVYLAAFEPAFGKRTSQRVLYIQ